MTAAELTLRLSQTWVNPTNKHFKDYVGKVFGRLTVIRYLGHTEVKCSNSIWYCQCTCGKFKAVTRRCLKSGIVRSCGCLQSELVSQRMRDPLRRTIPTHKTHGKTSTPEFNVWSKMKHRCSSPSNKCYRHYGGRGITVCDRWLHSFENFLTDMGARPTSKHSIDRIDGNGNYEPGNCRWATMTQQIRNRSISLHVTYEGVTRPLPEWCEIKGLSYHGVRQRLRKGWSPERAFETPMQAKVSQSAALAPPASP